MNEREQKSPVNQLLPVMAAWEEFIDWVLARTESFPKSVRYSLTSRIDNRVLAVAIRLIDARYAPKNQRLRSLLRINRDLEKLRLLFRVAHRRAILAHGAYEYASRETDRAGRMIGGWIKSIRHEERR